MPRPGFPMILTVVHVASLLSRERSAFITIVIDDVGVAVEGGRHGVGRGRGSHSVVR